MTARARDPVLLTPGPLTTSATVKEAMLHDWGSRDREFIAMTRRVCDSLIGLVGGEDTHACVPLQGSGTFAVEAMIGTLVPRVGKALVLVNGAYGRRMTVICERFARPYAAIETREDAPVSPDALDAALERDFTITHVLVVHCETTSGILNPLERIAEVCARHGRALLVDSMSAFGAIPVDARETRFTALAASANKCIEGVPGVGFVLAERGALEAAKGNSPSLALDLHDQWTAMERDGQWRFTPPTHVIAAFDRALAEHAAEGGVAGRGARYRRNCALLVEGMRTLGFRTLLPDSAQAPIIVTFLAPEDPRFDFARFYDALAARGYVIYPGKLTAVDSFRIGCIGRLGETEMRGALAAVRETLAEMGVRRCGPAAA